MEKRDKTIEMRLTKNETAIINVAKNFKIELKSTEMNILSAINNISGRQMVNNDINVPNNNQHPYIIQPALSREQYQQMYEFQS